MKEILTLVKKYPKTTALLIGGTALWVGFNSGGESNSSPDKDKPSATAAFPCRTEIDHQTGGKIIVSAVADVALPAGTTMHYTVDRRRGNNLTGQAPTGTASAEVPLGYMNSVTEAQATLVVPGIGDVPCKTTSD